LSKISLVISAVVTAAVLGTLVPEAKGFQVHPSGWASSHPRWEEPRRPRHHSDGPGSTSVPVPPTVVGTLLTGALGLLKARKKEVIE
jgi:hypothetical protein